MSLERLAKLTEKELQYLADDYRARDANEVHDLLRRLGDQSAHELALRRTAEPVQWIVDLEAQRRAIQIQVAGDARWIAAEDAGLYRDALGTVPTAGLPDSFLIPVEQALEKLLRRYARHRGPFPTRDPAARYNLRPVQVDPVLGALEAAGVLMRGEIRPDGAELEEQGQVRRGHFVDGLEGAQFAYAGAVDRLRASRRHAEERDWMVTIDDINALAAMDPANPYGALLPWPQTVDPKQPKPRRVAGAWILLARGRPVLYLGPRGRTLLRVNMADAAAAKSCTDRRVRNVMARGKHLFIELDNHTRSGSDLGRDQTECHRAPRARAS